MSQVKSDIQIAREAKMQPIKDILAKVNVPDESSAFSPMGRHIAKINLEYLDKLKNKSDGKLILVTAITPTPAGEGKTTTSVGLNDGLNKIGKKSIVCLREPRKTANAEAQVDTIKVLKNLFINSSLTVDSLNIVSGDSPRDLQPFQRGTKSIQGNISPFWTLGAILNEVVIVQKI